MVRDIAACTHAPESCRRVFFCGDVSRFSCTIVEECSGVIISSSAVQVTHGWMAAMLQKKINDVQLVLICATAVALTFARFTCKRVDQRPLPQHDRRRG
jgi:hypothetical protein